jgi:hypothetical protein
MILMNVVEKKNMKEMINAFYKWKQNMKNKKGKHSSVMLKIHKKKLNFGVWKHIEDEIRDSEKAIEKLKRRIIILKNEVLYGYIEKDKAITEYTTLRTNIVDESERLKLMYDYYIENVDNLENEMEVQKLQKEYNENLISLKNKMKLSSSSNDEPSKRKQIVTEMVQLSMFLTNLSNTIRAVKYPTIEITSDQGLSVKPYIMENMFRAYKTRNTVLISSSSNK